MARRGGTGRSGISTGRSEGREYREYRGKPNRSYTSYVLPGGFAFQIPCAEMQGMALCNLTLFFCVF